MSGFGERIDGNLQRMVDQGATYAEIDEYLRSEGFRMPARPEPEARGVLEEGGLVSQGVSGINEGLANIIGFPVDAATAGLNLMGAGIERPFGGSEQLRDLMAPTITDAEPQTGLQRIARRTGQEVGAAAVPVAGLLNMGRRAGQAAGPIMRALGIDQARRYPGRFAAAEGAAAVGGGVGAGVAGELAPDSVLAELAGQLIGGATPSLTRSMVGGVLEGAAPAFTEAGQRRAAGRALRDAAVYPDNAALELERGLEHLGTEGIEGLRPTTGALSGDPGLMTLERGSASGFDQAAFGNRRLNNEAAIRGELDQAAPSPEFNAATTARALTETRDNALANVDRAISNLTTGRTRGDASEAARGELEAALQEARWTERGMWRAIDESGAAVLFSDDLRGAVNDWMRELDPAFRDFIPEGTLRVLDGYGETVSFENLTNLRSRISNEIRSARGAQNYNQARVLGQLEGVVTDFIDNVRIQDPAILLRYDAARSFSRELHDRFSRGPAARALQLDATGTDRVAASDTLREFFRPDTARGASEASAQLRAMAGDDPERWARIQDAVQDYAMDVVVGTDGTVDARRLSDFVGRHRTALAAFPELRQRLGNVMSAQRLAADAGATGARTRADTQASAARFFLDREPETAIQQLLGSADPAAEATRLRGMLAGQPEAQAGLARAFWDHFIRTARLETDNPRGVESFGQQIRNFMRNPRHRAVANVLLTSDQQMALRRITEWSDVMARPQRVELPGSPTSQREAAQSVARRAGRYLLGALLTGGTVVASDATGELVGALTRRQRSALVQEALLDPALARDLLREVTPDAVPFLTRRLHLHLANLGMPLDEGQEGEGGERQPMQVHISP